MTGLNIHILKIRWWGGGSHTLVGGLSDFVVGLVRFRSLRDGSFRSGSVDLDR